MNHKTREGFIGRRFGNLVVEEPAGELHGRDAWRCLCDCGEYKIATAHDLMANKIVSCGCKKKAHIGGLNKTHGMTKTILYKKWQSMLNRCRNKNNAEFHRYGGRGITVCDEWHDFNNFKDWAESNGYSEDLTIERKDLNGNYCPDNCEWIERKKQAWNTSQTIWIEVDGKTVPLPKACESYGIPTRLARRRIRDGWDAKTALTSPKRINQFV